MRSTLRCALILACLLTSALTGCIRRTIEITSDPDGALVHLNGREVGRTPLTVDFLYYGTYDVVLEKDGYEPLLTSGVAEAPIWDNVPLDLFTEAVPGDLKSDVHWHYMLQPRNDDSQSLVDRARELRDQLAAAPIPESEPATTRPAASQPQKKQSHHAKP